MIYKQICQGKGKPFVFALIFKANFTAASKNSATFVKSSSLNPLDVRAGVPKVPQDKIYQHVIQNRN